MRRRIACNIVLLLLLALTLPCFSQDFPLIHFTKKEGLPSNMVYQVYRDSKGFLWFATDKGVSRFNGTRFETFTTSDGLTDNDVINLFEDHYGRLWLNGFKGSLCYYKDGKIYSPANSAFLNMPFNTSNVFAIIYEKDSSFTLLFTDRDVFVNIKDTTWRAYYLNKVPGKKWDDLPVWVSKGAPGTYDVLTVHGSLVMDTSYNTLFNHTNKPGIKYRCRIGQDMTYLVSENAIYSNNKQIYNFTRPNENFDNVNSLYVDSTNIFLGTEKGLIINNGTPLLKDCRISDVSKDINGNYWVTTLNNGVFHFNRHFQDVNHYGNSYEGTVRFAFEEKGTLFFATSAQSLFRFSKGKASRIFDMSKYREGSEQPIQEPGYVTDDQGNYHLLQGFQHFILGNLLADKPAVKTNHIVRSPIYYVYLIFSTKAICSTPQYIYIVMGGNYMLRLDRSKVSTGNASALEIVIRYSDGQRIYAMAKTGDNTIMFSTGKGMYKLEDKTPVLLTSFKGLSLHRFYILGNYIVGWNNSNRLIICNNINSDRMIADTVALQDCIWDKAYPLDGQRLLISTNNQYRVLQLKPGGGRPAYELSTVEDPFIPGDAEYIFSNGHTCYFFKNGNITAVPVPGLLKKAVLPRLFFTSVSTPHKTYTTGADSLSIPFGESGSIHISFAALAFGMTNTTYEYSVSRNRQDNWQVIKSEEINLLSAHYGDYTIKVRAKSASNVYSEPVSLLLTIERPFWATWWFILLMVLCGAALLWWMARIIILYSVRKKEQVYASEIKFMKLEYKALNALMNPHFIFNSLNNIQGLVNGDNRQAANQYLVTFADLIRQNMHNASKELITLEKEMELIGNYLKLEKLRFNEWLNYSIDIEEHIDTGSILIPPLLVQPLVENAIRHGLVHRQSADSLLTVRIHEDDDEVLYIEVRDNGAGLSGSRKQASLYESTGLENIRKRTAQLKLIHNIDVSFHISEIKDRSGAVQGTLAVISIQPSGPAQQRRS